MDPLTPRCRVCGGGHVATKRIKCSARGYRGVAVDFHSCSDCGFVAAPGNRHRYEPDGSTFGASSRPGKGVRAGDGVRRGREYYMFATAREILDRTPIDVLVHGPGLSRDHELIARDDTVAEAAITDLHNYQGAGTFIPLDGDRTFDIVVCCEVAEHFDDPRAEFEKLLRFVAPSGLLVVSTNVSDGASLQRLAYPFIKGHVAYYSGAALVELGRSFGFSVDFRMPRCSRAAPGPRKRYIFFYRARELAQRISLWFSGHPYAYSE